MKSNSEKVHSVAIAVHGGAGTIRKGSQTAEREAEYIGVISQSLRAGHAILKSGGSAVDAVVTSVMILENSPLFNAGRGAVYTADSTHELDAAIMDGASRSAGAVAGVTRVRNPIELAKLVMEKSAHVLLIGTGAERFAQEHAMQLVSNDYFDTPDRLESLRAVRANHQAILRGEPAPSLSEAEKHGTVGCVALDCHGDLAAATSTGGMTNKRPGRVGDTPIIGAGTFADNQSCAISCTGHGEFFMRWVVAHEVASQMRYAMKSVHDAAHDVINCQLQAVGASGGLIAIDGAGNIAMPFNSDGMYRGSIDTQDQLFAAMYK